MTSRPILSAEEERQVAASERIFAAVHAYLVEMEETEEGGEEIEIRQFEAMKAAIAVADRARDQRAEREDAQRPRPEAASPVVDATSGGEAPGRDEGWQPIETAPKDGTEVLLWTRDGLYAAAWLKDGQAGSCQEDWHTYDGYKWYVICSNPPTAWMPQPSAPRPSQREG